MSVLPDYGLLFDVIVAVMLGVTITYSVILNRKLTTFRNGREEMGALVKEFAEAIRQAEQGMAAIREAAEGSGEALQAKVESADRLADDLAYLMKRADLAVGKLEEATQRSRNPLYRSSSLATPRAGEIPRAEDFAAAKPQLEPKSGRVAGETEPEPGARAPAEPAAPKLSSEESQLLKVLQGMR